MAHLPVEHRFGRSPGKSEPLRTDNEVVGRVVECRHAQAEIGRVVWAVGQERTGDARNVALHHTTRREEEKGEEGEGTRTPIEAAPNPCPHHAGPAKLMLLRLLLRGAGEWRY
jgi:hypothetical protein